MAWTQDDIDALQTAIGAGVKRVRYSDGSETEYHSLKEMRSLLSEMKASLATKKPVRAFRGAPRSGY
ncbi:hypothetical protein FHS78_000622 [Parvibaculum indicum]|uniref:phage head-tail joining protein n=1 Tax=Parvibaculum indicum TaxID=562969 RepID=UPI0014208A88|nr:hypothetical protein [Parvibaculum indicum]NIJ40352.1 hypothetical protein [Parvibaculum indicum]